jgi:ELWxxDGT repeat protein
VATLDCTCRRPTGPPRESTPRKTPAHFQPIAPTTNKPPGDQLKPWPWQTSAPLCSSCPYMSNLRKSPHYAVTAALALFFWVDARADSAAMLKDLRPGPDGSAVTFGLELNGRALFTATDGSASGLWISDGTAAGTQFLSPASFITDPFRTIPSGIQLGDSLVYAGYAGYVSNQTAELWRTDGTSAGTIPLLDFGRGGFGGGSQVARCGAGFVRMGDKAYFGVSAPDGQKLFRTDGTPAGTMEIGSFPGAACAMASQPGVVFFRSSEPNASGTLWRSNGEPGGHEPVRDMGGSPVRAVYAMQEMGGSLYFFAQVGNAVDLYRLTPGDPTAHLVLARTWSSRPGMPVMNGVIGGVLLFRDMEPDDNGGPSPVLLYRTDGTQSGTYPLSEVHDSTGASLESRFFYTGPRDAESFNLWITDGTTSGTTAIPINVSPSQIFPSTPFIPLDGHMYFMTRADGRGRNPGQLWRSDGTSGGTRRVSAAPQLSLESSGTNHAVVDGRLLLVGASTNAGEEPWVYTPNKPNPSDGGGGGGTGWPEAAGLALLLVRSLRLLSERASRSCLQAVARSGQKDPVHCQGPRPAAGLTPSRRSTGADPAGRKDAVPALSPETAAARTHAGCAATTGTHERCLRRHKRRC